MNSAVVVLLAVVLGSVLPGFLAQAKQFVKRKLNSRKKVSNEAVLDSLSGLNKSIVVFANSLKQVEFELQHIKGQLQTLDQTVQQVKQDNNVVVAGIGGAEARLQVMEKASLNTVNAVNKMAELLSQSLDIIVGKRRIQAAANRQEEETNADA